MRLLATVLKESRRRRMFRVAGLYILGAWGVIQAADLAFESWGIPATALRYIWIGSILAFPIALILGWRYDIVDGRIVRTVSDQREVDLSLRFVDYLIISALAVATAITVYGVGFGISVERPQQSVEVPTTAPTLNPHAVAVLPFDEMGDDENLSQILAMGLQDDLLTRLSRIQSIHVISRTSVEQYRDSTRNMRAIGEDLGVGKIIEGGVTYFNDRVRVNVQLIESVTDKHLWAETYDYDLTAENLFDVQTEIVEAVVGRLAATLTASETLALAAAPTNNLEAYTEYLKGKQLADTESEEAINRAIEHFKAALRLDPNFGLAHVGLADAYLTLSVRFLGNMTAADSVVLAEPHITLALQLDPTSAEAYTSLGLLRQAQQRWQDAGMAFEQAMELNPNYTRAYLLHGNLHWLFGNLDRATELIDTALGLDPYSGPVNFVKARLSDESGDFADALTRYQRVLAANPDHALAYVYVAAIYYLVYGRAEESLIWYHRAAESDALSPAMQAAPAFAYLELGDLDSARFWAEQGTQRGPNTFWTLWAQVLLNVYEDNDEMAREYARQMLDVRPKDASALRILRDLDVKAGRNEVALLRYQSLYPELFDEQSLQIHPNIRRAAADLVLVLQNAGREQHARRLAETLVEFLDTQVRLGASGYWIDDARALAAIGETGLALDRLKIAVDAGWLALSWYFLDRDPSLESIRDDPAFQDLRRRIWSDLATQAENLAAMKASGELRLGN